LFQSDAISLVEICEDDLDHCSLILSTDPLAASSTALVVFPNPSQGIVRVNMEGENVHKMRIYSVFGQLISMVSDSHVVDLSIQPDGIYLLEIITRSGLRYVEKIQIVHD